jgi:osmoprotectant transport system substrate-binding protein
MGSVGSIGRTKSAIALAMTLTAVLAACGTSGSSNGGVTTTTRAPVEGTIASKLALGGPPECSDRPLCAQGLQSVYGATFREVQKLDAGGKLTVAALKNNSIQIGLIFTSDGQIEANGWVLLNDDKNWQPADQVTPIANDAIATAYGEDLAKVVNGISGNIKTADLVKLNKSVDVDLNDTEAVAKDFVKLKNLLPTGDQAPKSGPTIKVGSANFSEDATLASIYAEVLKAYGYPVEVKLKVGSREVYYPLVKANGDVNFVPDYGGTLLTFVDPAQTPTTDATKTHDAVAAAIKKDGITAYEAAQAEDKNGFVVTRETAARYNLKNLSDLAKNVP